MWEWKKWQLRTGLRMKGQKSEGKLLGNTTMIICKWLTHTPPLKFFVKLNFSFEEIICCIYSVVSLLLRRYKARHSCLGTVLSRAACAAKNKSSGSVSQTQEHKLYWEDRVKIQTFPEGWRFQGLLPGGAWKLPTWPDLSSPGRAGSSGWGQQPQELLFSLPVWHMFYEESSKKKTWSCSALHNWFALHE